MYIYITPLPRFTDMSGTKKFAYLTLVMKGEEYVSGALVLAQSLRKSGTQYNIDCMVTADVGEKAIEHLQIYFNNVHVFNYYEADVIPLRSRKAQGFYGPWMSSSLTWYKCLTLTQYEKVFLLDSDVAVLRCMDNIFDLPTPAGCFHSFWKPSEYYNRLRHGDKVDSGKIIEALNDEGGSVVCIGNGLLLSPADGLFDEFVECMETFKASNGGNLGFRHSLSGINEQMIAYFYVEIGKTWTQIGTQYQVIPWHRVPGSKESPYLFHYFNLKPWRMHLAEYVDLQVWWRFAATIKDIENYIPRDLHVNLEMIKGFLTNFCFWCGNHGHSFISENCEIPCPTFMENRQGVYGLSKLFNKKEGEVSRKVRDDDSLDLEKLSVGEKHHPSKDPRVTADKRAAAWRGRDALQKIDFKVASRKKENPAGSEAYTGKYGSTNTHGMAKRGSAGKREDGGGWH